MRHLTVRDVMTEEVVVVRLTTPFKEVARVLADHGISALPVLDENDRLAGVVSEADLLYKEEYGTQDARFRLLASPEERAARSKATADSAGQLMTSPAITIGPDAPLVEAAKVMDQHKVKRLPVVDGGGQLIGLVSRADLLRTFLRDDDEIREEVIRDVFMRILWAEPEKFEVTVDDGVVTLSGELQLRSSTVIAVRLTRKVDGVVDVIDKLSYQIDDHDRLASLRF
ncbi:MAG TPA: CBS domain-containing protein [Actinomycetes bacterium]|nr:CBS domain-containing protein [Actinomycetes bacterium]